MTLLHLNIDTIAIIKSLNFFHVYTF